ncbi:MAG: hypothetical protein RMK62_09950, partial [Armatimonadota bacterium]|nr:hypothetical protein [Armatimonadota bacterium]
VGIATGSAPTEPVQLANADGVVPVASGTARPFITYSEAIQPRATSSSRDWLFIVPPGVTAFEFVVLVEANPASSAPVEATAGTTGSPSVLVSTLAGSTSDASGYLDGVGTAARFAGIFGLAVDAFGNAYIADTANHSVRRLTPSGLVTTVAGSVGVAGSGVTDGVGTVARFDTPTGIAVAADGRTLYIADWGNRRIRRAVLTGLDPTNPASWTVATIAGGATGTPDQDGTGDQATFHRVYDIALDPTGNLYVTTDTTSRIRRIQFKGGNPALASSWQVSTLLSVGLNQPKGIAADREGNVYIADSGSGEVKKVTPDGSVTTIASGLQNPTDLSVDAAGYVYVVETDAHLVRRISPSGTLATVAGTGTAGFLDGRGDSARFNRPQAIAVDRGGNLLVSDGPNGGRRVVVIQRIVQSGSP